MNRADITHVDVLHALLVVHRHLAIVRRVADEIRVLDQLAAAIIEMNCEGAEWLRMHRRLDLIHRRHVHAPECIGQRES